VRAVLDRHGMVNRGRKRCPKPQGTTPSKPLLPNDLWCADYKGEFMLADSVITEVGGHDRANPLNIGSQARTWDQRTKNPLVWIVATV
jgi:hypothetical protein